MVLFMNTSKANKSTQRKRTQRQKSSESAASSGFLHTAKSALFGSAIGIAAVFALMTIGAFICYSSGDPNSLIDIVAIVSVYLSSLACGFAAVKKNRSSALLCGSLSGVFMMLFFIICSIFFGSNAESEFKFPVSILLRVAIIAVAVLGGYMGLKRGNNKKRTRKASR